MTGACPRVGDGQGAPGCPMRQDREDFCRRGRQHETNRKMHEHRMKSARTGSAGDQVAAMDHEFNACLAQIRYRRV
jgi:hypothetical protein